MTDKFEFKPPRLLEDGEKLFKPDNDWWHNACLNFARDEWYLYACGFYRAASILVNHLKTERTDLDTVIYPLSFIYRQYLELSLKIIIRDGSKLLDLPDEIPTVHNLQKLWTKARSVLSRIFEDSIQSELIALDKLIYEFMEIDPESFSFRYPVDKKGNPSLPSLEKINIRNLEEFFEGIESFIESVLTAISVYLDHKREMQSECW